MNLLDLAGSPGEPAAAMCSRKACRADAAWQLMWNNPRVHTPERRKVWLACPEHRDWLEDYLRTRGLWKDTVALDPESPDTGRDAARTETAAENGGAR